MCSLWGVSILVLGNKTYPYWYFGVECVLYGMCSLLVLGNKTYPYWYLGVECVLYGMCSLLVLGRVLCRPRLPVDAAYALSSPKPLT